MRCIARVIVTEVLQREVQLVERSSAHSLSKY